MKRFWFSDSSGPGSWLHVQIGYYPNGRSKNYDGTGRNAEGNDTLYLPAWLMYRSGTSARCTC